MAIMKHALAAALFAASLITPPLAAQQAPPGDLDQDMLEAYTKAHIALNAARDDYQGQLGRTHDAQEQARLRAELAERSASVLARHEISAVDYDRITALISVDESLRTRFEALLAALTAGAGAG